VWFSVYIYIHIHVLSSWRKLYRVNEWLKSSPLVLQSFCVVFVVCQTQLFVKVYDVHILRWNNRWVYLQKTADCSLVILLHNDWTAAVSWQKIYCFCVITYLTTLSRPCLLLGWTCPSPSRGGRGRDCTVLKVVLWFVMHK